MHFTTIAPLLLLATKQVAAHGLITRIHGANGVVMPGLTVVDGTPRDCPSGACGGQKDTAIIRDPEMGTSEASALGRTMSGPVDPKRVIVQFMGSSAQKRAHTRHFPQARQLANDAASIFTTAGGTVLNGAQDLADATPLGNVVKGAQSTVDTMTAGATGTKPGVMTPDGTVENGLQEYAGKGAAHGLPSVSGDGYITVIYHQVNQDGAGPLHADVDATSGGTDPKAFKPAKVVENIPGVAGASTTSTMDFEVKIQVPAGTKCTGVVDGIENVCIVRVRNSAISGPFGGSAAFTN
ncbi:uncharacterized protein N7498_006582 [Penicillium cinerascens]|uniref:Cell surface protein Mas1 n=1 Tax=Penicillium cinerascens TaxID=70096 RepID=A0A9W9SXH5_9EURO|nr:uncharacterized protein N7498_006582 [Penicillium cinerascens]KAJ5201919.1 hypothetical protein N7498_006582 [Penicillium cinerascens]